ncbi:hypothetical protein ADE_32810 [Achromobacter denitrificans]|nr:hypothetical protein ADE_32810 [Achromobacter denitrificans]
MDIATRVTPDTYGTRLDLKTQYDNFIDGKWQKPADGEYFDNVTPVTGQILTRNARSKERDIELALDAAHRAAPKWGGHAGGRTRPHADADRRRHGGQPRTPGHRRNLG